MEDVIRAVTEPPAPEVIGPEVPARIREEAEQPDTGPDGEINLAKHYDLKGTLERLLQLLKEAPRANKIITAC